MRWGFGYLIMNLFNLFISSSDFFFLSLVVGADSGSDSNSL